MQFYQKCIDKIKSQYMKECKLGRISDNTEMQIHNLVKSRAKQAQNAIEHDIKISKETLNIFKNYDNKSYCNGLKLQVSRQVHVLYYFQGIQPIKWE